MNSAPKSFLGKPQTIVYVKVGTPAQTFGLHEDLVCANSVYFERALKGGFKEAKTKEIILQTDSPVIFGLFSEWLYTRRIIETMCFNEKLSATERMNAEKPSFEDLISLWKMADYFHVPRLQNQILDLINYKFSRHKQGVLKCIAPAYNGTLDGSPLRKFVSQTAASSLRLIGVKEFQGSVGDCPKEFLMDAIGALEERMDSRRLGKFLSTDEVRKFHLPVTTSDGITGFKIE